MKKMTVTSEALAAAVGRASQIKMRLFKAADTDARLLVRVVGSRRLRSARVRECQVQNRQLDLRGPFCHIGKSPDQALSFTAKRKNAMKSSLVLAALLALVASTAVGQS